MIRLLVEDVTMVRGEQIRLHFRFRGGATQKRRSSEPAENLGNVDDGCRGREQNRPAAGYSQFRRDCIHPQRQRFQAGQRKALHGTLHRPHSKAVFPSFPFRPTAGPWHADAGRNGGRTACQSQDRQDLGCSWFAQSLRLYGQAGASVSAARPRRAQESTGHELASRRPASSIMPECSNEVQYEA